MTVRLSNRVIVLKPSHTKQAYTYTHIIKLSETDFLALHEALFPTEYTMGKCVSLCSCGEPVNLRMCDYA